MNRHDDCTPRVLPRLVWRQSSRRAEHCLHPKGTSFGAHTEFSDRAQYPCVFPREEDFVCKQGSNKGAYRFMNSPGQELAEGQATINGRRADWKQSPGFKAKKNPLVRVFLSVGQTLLDFGFLVDHVLARLRIILPGFHLPRMLSFVFCCRIEVTGSGTRDKSDFLSHLTNPHAVRFADPVPEGRQEPSQCRVCR